MELRRWYLSQSLHNMTEQKLSQKLWTLMKSFSSGIRSVSSLSAPINPINNSWIKKIYALRPICYRSQYIFSLLVVKNLKHHLRVKVVMHQWPLPGSKSPRFFSSSGKPKNLENFRSNDWNSMLDRVYELKTSMHVGFENNYYSVDGMVFWCLNEF